MIRHFSPCNLFAARKPLAARKASNRLRPTLVALEDRQLLTTFTVTNPADSGPGTLRAALVAANAASDADTIEFQPGLGAITLTSDQLSITRPVTITGPAGGVTIQRSDAVDTPAFRIFAVSGTAPVTLENLTIRNGNLTYGGGIFNSGTLTVTASTLSGNSAGSEGGGIYNYGKLTVNASTLSGNSALSRNGGGIYNTDTGVLTVTASTLSGNSARIGGGGIYNTNGAMLTVNASTLSGNSAGLGGGIRNQSGTATLNNTIVANSGTGGELFGTFAGSHNLISAGGLSNLTSTVIGDPDLGPLAANGGPTLTHALPADSPAINAGDNTLIPAGLTTDQRGHARVSGGTVDIGAFEASTASSTTAVGGTFVYDGTPHAGSGSVDVSGGSVTLYYQGVGSTTYSSAAAPTDAGTYTVSASYAGNAFYDASSAWADLTITAKRLEVTALSPGTINIGSNGTISLNLSVAAGQLHGADTVASLFDGAVFSIAIQNADGGVTHGTFTSVARVEADGSITVTLRMDDTLRAALYSAYQSGRAVNFDLSATANGGNYEINSDTTSRLLNNGAKRFIG